MLVRIECSPQMLVYKRHSTLKLVFTCTLLVVSSIAKVPAAGHVHLVTLKCSNLVVHAVVFHEYAYIAVLAMAHFMYQPSRLELSYESCFHSRIMCGL